MKGFWLLLALLIAGILLLTNPPQTYLITHTPAYISWRETRFTSRKLHEEQKARVGGMKMKALERAVERRIEQVEEAKRRVAEGVGDDGKGRRERERSSLGSRLEDV